MSKNIPRPHYTDKVISGKDAPFIKIITGMRRSGKSTVLSMVRDEIEGSGVSEDRILMIDFDIESPETPYDCSSLLSYISSRIDIGPGAYIFMDEIQNVNDWETAVTSLHASGADVYITGSNSQMLSSELATRLSGRCIEICIRPLVFSEYVTFRQSDDTGMLFNDFLHDGGLPAVALSEDGPSKGLIPEILTGTYSTVFMKDVISRYEIRNPAGLSNIARFLMRNIGDRISPRNVSNYLTSKGQKISHISVEEYLEHLTDAFLFSRSERIDSKTKEYLQTSDKFYCSDMGIRNNVVPFRIEDIDGMLENIVYNELLFRFSEVAICSVGGLEINFIAEPNGTPSYYQVCTSISNPEMLERELRPLRNVPDNYEKFIITYERFLTEDINGIRVVQIIDWLLEK